MGREGRGTRDHENRGCRSEGGYPDPEGPYQTCASLELYPEDDGRVQGENRV